MPILLVLLFAWATTIRPALAQETSLPPLHHVGTLHGVRFDHESVFETFPVAAPGQPAGAGITTFTYLHRDKRGRRDRPVLFAFNGGPGAPSIFLNVGVLGPKRVVLPDNVSDPVPLQPRLVANEESILDLADLVLIDPVGTGLSRPADPHSAEYFYSVQGDAAAVATVITQWSHKHQRAGSKKFVLGESYGAVRAVEVLKQLADTDDRESFKGLILLSQSLPILDTVQRPSNVVGQVVGIGTIAATAWYHQLAGKGESLESFVREAQQFATNEWLPALFAGRALDPEKRLQTAQQLARFTGLTSQYFLAHDLYLSKDAYRREALANKGLVLGASDTRYVGAASAGADPSGPLVLSLLSTASELLRQEFGLQDVTDYRSTDGLDEWMYVRPPFDPTTGRHYAQMDYAAHLVTAMAALKSLSVFIAGGWFDTHASIGADDYLATRPGLDTGRVIVRRYRGGHMFYTDTQSRAQFAHDLRAFMADVNQPD